MSILLRDSASILAEIASKHTDKKTEESIANKKYTEEDGVFYIERDWWLFRYILAFLRDGTLPGETSLLIALYREANFYSCLQLQYAIEEKKVYFHSLYFIFIFILYITFIILL